MRKRVEVLEEERTVLQQHLDNLKSAPPPTDRPEDSLGPDAAERLVHEERLKWQLDVVNVRRELEEKLNKEQYDWTNKMNGLKQEMSKIEKEMEENRISAHQEVEKLQIQLERSQQRSAC